LAALRCVCLLAAAWLAGVEAHAQMVAPDPLAPKLSTDPRSPPAFRKFDQPAQAQLGPPPNFTPPASGAGDTGFDATNTRKKTKAAKPKPKSTTSAPSAAATPVLPSVSPYQKPPPGSGTALAQAPGAPPVGDVGPIRQMPKKRAASSGFPRSS
jgi:hypothetical protein